MTAKIPLFRELSAQAVLIIVFFKKKCRLVGEIGLKLLDLFEVKFHFHLVKNKMAYVAVGMALDEVNLIVEIFFDDRLQLCVKFLNLCRRGRSRTLEKSVLGKLSSYFNNRNP